MIIIFVILSFLASIIGSICGIGGGVIIKPVIDATGLMSVAQANFLSGCTVLAMSATSVGRSLLRGDKEVDTKRSTPLAIGAIIGGLSGEKLFQFVRGIFESESSVGLIQTVTLLLVIIGILLYHIFSDNIKKHQFENVFLCIGAGVFLGIISSFLGIGGGPIVLIVLSFLFSMTAKKAAMNSLYIIVFSQLSSVILTTAEGRIPTFSISILVFMIIAGIGGGLVGSMIHKRISDRSVSRLFMAVLCVLVLINCWNLCRFILFT